MANNKVKRKQRATVLVVGEGDCDVAFLKHLRGLYCSGKPVAVNISIRNAHGKGPEHVVDFATKQQGGYDRRVAFLDKDIPWTDKLRKQASTRVENYNAWLGALFRRAATDYFAKAYARRLEF